VSVSFIVPSPINHDEQYGQSQSHGIGPILNLTRLAVIISAAAKLQYLPQAPLMLFHLLLTEEQTVCGTLLHHSVIEVNRQIVNEPDVGQKSWLQQYM